MVDPSPLVASAAPPGGALGSDSGGAGGASRTMPEKARPPIVACISTPASSATLHTLARIDDPSRIVSPAALRPIPGRRPLCGPHIGRQRCAGGPLPRRRPGG